MYVFIRRCLFSAAASRYRVQLLCDVVIVLLLIKFTAYAFIVSAEERKEHEIKEKVNPKGIYMSYKCSSIPLIEKIAFQAEFSHTYTLSEVAEQAKPGQLYT